MSNPGEVGQVTEGIILAELLKRGVTVLSPFGHIHRYDFVLDIDGMFYRIQCKTARHAGYGSIKFNAYSMNGGSNKRLKRDYRGQIEFFAIYEPSVGVLLVRPEDVSTLDGFIRITPSTRKYPASHPCGRVKLAADCSLDKVLEELRLHRSMDRTEIS